MWLLHPTCVYVWRVCGVCHLVLSMCKLKILLLASAGWKFVFGLCMWLHVCVIVTGVSCEDPNEVNNLFHPFHTHPSPSLAITHTHSSVALVLLAVTTLSYVLLLHEFPHHPILWKIYMWHHKGRVQRCHFVSSEWQGRALILQLSCKTLMLSVRTLIRRQVWKIHILLFYRVPVQAGEYVLPQSISFSYQPLKVVITEILQNPFVWRFSCYLYLKTPHHI